MTLKLRSEMSSQKIDTSADIRFESLTLLEGFVILDLNTRNTCFTTKLLKQGYQYCNLRKAFSQFYRRHSEFVSKFKVGLNHFTSRPIGTRILC